MTRTRPLTFVTLLALVAACGGNKKIGDAAVRNQQVGNAAKQGDTIAVPAVAVDTTTNRPPGVVSKTGKPGSYEGVDTPITHKMGSPAKAKP